MKHKYYSRTYENVYPADKIVTGEGDLVLFCTPLRFYTQRDEDLLFAWLDSIACITKYEGIGRVLNCYIASTKISDDDLLNLMGIFDRYKFDAKQLRIFMNDDNRDLF